MRELSEIIGHTAERQQLQRMAESNRIPHALIFAGISGIGKRTTALAVALELLSQNSLEKNRENHKKLLATASHPDLHFLTLADDKKDIAVEDVRGLIDALHLKPYLGSVAVGIIDKAEKMSIAAANALLMTLEEPSPGKYLILVTSAPQLLLPTIQSRAQTVTFAALTQHELRELLQSIRADLGELPLSDLVPLCDGSLDGLDLEQFFCGRTSRLQDKEGLIRHLNDVSTQTKAVIAKLNAAITHPAAALETAAELAKDQRSSTLVWKAIRKFARDQLRNSTAKDMNRNAAFLLEALRVERMVRERNLSPELQLSELLCCFSRVV